VLGNLLHRGGIEALHSEKIQSTFENVAPSLLALVGGRPTFDHVQTMPLAGPAVNKNLNMVKIVSSLTVSVETK